MFRRVFLALPLVSLAMAGGAFAQADATLILRSGERIKGELSGHGGAGFTVRVNGEDRRIPTNDVAIVDFAGTEMTDADWARAGAGTHVLWLKNGTTFSGRFYGISGGAPLSIVIKTASGEQRTFSSTETARIVLARPAGAVATSGTAAAPAAGGGIVVPATDAWVSAGMRVRRGEWVTFNTTGEIRLTTDAADVAGAAGSNANRTAANAPVPGTPIGTLIGRVGDSRPFVIGNQARVQMPAGGMLFLGINDDHLADNSGQFRVQVRGGGR